jgi:hypothetical protein
VSHTAVYGRGALQTRHTSHNTFTRKITEMHLKNLHFSSSCNSPSNPAFDQAAATTAAANPSAGTADPPSVQQSRQPTPTFIGRSLAQSLIKKLRPARHPGDGATALPARPSEPTPSPVPSMADSVGTPPSPPLAGETASLNSPQVALSVANPADIPPVPSMADSVGTPPSPSLAGDTASSNSSQVALSAANPADIPLPPSPNDETASAGSSQTALFSTRPADAPAQTGTPPSPAAAERQFTDVGTQFPEKHDINKTRNLSDLPPEIQLQILSMLPLADRKRYRLIAKFADAIGKLTFPNINVSSTEDLKAALCTHGEDQIRSLVFTKGNFDSLHFKNGELRDLMRRKLGRLESLNVLNCDNLSMDGVENLLNNRIPKPEQLKQLTVSGNKVLHTLNERNLLEIPKKLSGLTHLNMRLSNPNHSIGYLDVRGALYHLSNLTHLNVSEYGDHNLANNPNCLNDGTLAGALEKKLNLTYLNLSGCGTLTLQGIANALTGAPNLTHLVLADLNIDSGTAHMLSDVLLRARGLTHLDLSNMEGLTGQNFDDASAHVPNLEQLNVAGCSDLINRNFNSFLNALERANELTGLNISNVGHRLRDETLNQILEKCGSRLTSLEMSSSAISFSMVSEDGLNDALKKTPNLERLDVSSSFIITNLVLPPLASLKSLNASSMDVLKSVDLGQLPALENLSLSSSDPTFDMATLQHALASVKDNLTHLSLSSFAGLGDDHLTDLSSFDKLRYLDLSDNDDITDAALTPGRLPPWLEYLSVKGCAKLTDAALKNLPETIQVVQY